MKVNVQMKFLDTMLKIRESSTNRRTDKNLLLVREVGFVEAQEEELISAWVVYLWESGEQDDADADSCAQHRVIGVVLRQWVPLDNDITRGVESAEVAGAGDKQVEDHVEALRTVYHLLDPAVVWLHELGVDGE